MFLLLILGKGKLLCWKAFLEAVEDSVTALANLGNSSEPPTEDVIAGIEKLVCKLYQPKTKLVKVKNLRWLYFRKKKAQSERLPPTLWAQKEAIARMHYQCMVWCNDVIPTPELPSTRRFWMETTRR